MLNQSLIFNLVIHGVKVAKHKKICDNKARILVKYLDGVMYLLSLITFQNPLDCMF